MVFRIVYLFNLSFALACVGYHFRSYYLCCLIFQEHISFLIFLQFLISCYYLRLCFSLLQSSCERFRVHAVPILQGPLSSLFLL
jgi:hypothetical protein